MAALIDEVRRLRVLAEVADTVTQRPSLDHQLPRLIELITQVLDAERATLFLLDRSTGDLFSRVLSGEGVAEIRIPANVGIAGAVFSTGVAEIIPDAYRDSRFNPDIDRRTRYRTRNILCVPLRNRDGEMIGVTEVLNKRSGDFDAADRGLLEAITRHAANTLQQSYVVERLEQTERALQRTNRALLTLSRGSQAVGHAESETKLLKEICRIIVEEAGYRFCWVGRAENDMAKSVSVVAHSGYEAGYLATLSITWADAECGRGPIGRCIRTGRVQLASDIATDPSMIPWRSEALKRGYGSCAAIPLVSDSAVFGAIMIYAVEGDAFGTEEVALLSELADDLGYGIGSLHTRAERYRAEAEIRELNAVLEQRVIDRTAQLQAANTELEQARERETEIGFRIQQSLLLDQPPQDLPGLGVAALTIPSQRIDGDFYIFIPHSNGCLDVIVGDVMGKGVPAALLGAAAKSHLLRALSDLMALSRNGRLPEPKEIVMLAHAGLVRRLIDLDSFVTLVYARFDVKRQRLDLVDCGHTGVIHWRRETREYTTLHGNNLPLGVREGEIYDHVSVPFEANDLLLFFSDGITEARNASGEFFGAARLEECVASNSELQPGALVEAIRKATFSFAGAGRLTDDLTTVAVRVEERLLPIAQAEIEIGSDLTNLRQAREFVRGFCHDLPGGPLDEDGTAALELAVDEATSNIMKHAYQGRSDQWIHLEAEAFPGHVAIRLHHLGDPFNPAAVAPPSFDGSRDSGFGAYIISRSVDEVRYYRDERGRHCIALVKLRKSPDDQQRI